MYAGIVANPDNLEARNLRSPDISWYLLKSIFLTVIG